MTIFDDVMNEALFLLLRLLISSEFFNSFKYLINFLIFKIRKKICQSIPVSQPVSKKTFTTKF